MLFKDFKIESQLEDSFNGIQRFWELGNDADDLSIFKDDDKIMDLNEVFDKELKLSINQMDSI